MSDEVYSRGRLIAHAGGNLSGRKYTNSKEALELNLNSASLLEFDVCRASDGLIVAHDGLEKRYGLEGSFTDYTMAEFRSASYHKKYTPREYPKLCV